MSSYQEEKFSTVERISEKKEFDIIKEYDRSSCTNFNLKSSKILTKKCKKGVDSLLEKLENNNKKSCSSDNFGSSNITSAEEKDSHSIKSMSPDNCKSRSPYCRDDVISPALSNDDSNDMKQRRKRKLGKPLKLAKDGKFDDYIKLSLAKSNLPINSEDINNSIDSHLDLSNETLMPNLTSLNNESLRCKLNKLTTNLKTFFPQCSNKNIFVEQIDDNNVTEKKNVVQISKTADFTRIRRRSECFMKPFTRNKRIRRKSCSDIKELLHKSIPEINVSRNNVTFNEVESQLEEMFAGLIESDKDALKKNVQDVHKQLNLLSEYEQKENLNTKRIVNLSHSTGVTSKLKINHNCKRKRTRNTSIIKKLKKKKTSTLKKKRNKSDNIQDTFSGSDFISNNSFKYKGPIIHIEGSDTSPNFAQIMNVSKDEDEEKNKEKRKNNFSSTSVRGKKTSFQINPEYQGKTCNARLFNSTLSIRYDAHTADITWICVLCKKGPHFIVPRNPSEFFRNPSYSETHTIAAGVLSDLFGPYLISKDYLHDHVEPISKVGSLKEQNNENKYKQGYQCLGILEQFSANSNNINKKKKQSSSNEELSQHNISTLDTVNQECEIWLHEQCITWSAGVYITGGRINGLQDAVLDATKSLCDFCGLSGANIGCVKRGCKSIVHYCCALATGWHLDTDQYIPKCNIHQIN